MNPSGIFRNRTPEGLIISARGLHPGPHFGGVGGRLAGRTLVGGVFVGAGGSLLGVRRDRPDRELPFLHLDLVFLPEAEAGALQP